MYSTRQSLAFSSPCYATTIAHKSPRTDLRPLSTPPFFSPTQKRTEAIIAHGSRVNEAVVENTDSRVQWSNVSIATFCGIIGIQAAGYLPSLPAAVLLSTSICAYAWTKRFLSTSGLIAAWGVFAMTHHSSVILSAMLLVFFLSASLLTDYKSRIKDNIISENKKQRERNWTQVLCNGGLPTLFAIQFAKNVAFLQAGVAALNVPPEAVFWFGCCLGSFAFGCGDTWASELGSVSKSAPRLITTFKRVPRGTNGGVSLLGLGSSIAGGLLIGVTAFVMSILSVGKPLATEAMQRSLPLIAIGAAAGLLGSLIDSLLGATLQFSGWDEKQQRVVNRPNDSPDSSVFRIAGFDILSNDQVNLISSFLTAIIAGKVYFFLLV